MTKVELERISEPDMYIFEQGMRVEFLISNRYSKAVCLKS